MFLAKMKFALVACGLIATGALMVAQQVGTAMPEAKVRTAIAGVPENRLDALRRPR